MSAIYLLSANCVCGQPIVTTATEWENPPTDDEFQEAVMQSKTDLREAMRNGSLMTTCRTCQQPINTIELEMYETEFRSIAEANARLSEFSQGSHAVRPQTVN